MSKQIYDVGDVIQAGTNVLEVTGVTYREDPDTQEKSEFTYQVRLKSEVDALRAAEAEQKAAHEAAAKEQAKLTPTQVSDPDAGPGDEEGTE